MEIRNKLITHMRFFLINKLFLLRKEVYYIKWSINYIRTLDIQLNNIEEENTNNDEKSQFIKDCELIIDFIEMINKKIKDILNKLSDDELRKKSILELIILFDCINERINNSILKKFDYVYKAYENLVLSYNHLYIPTTSVSKLAKTPNLMLFFNRKLNYISEIFSELIKDTNINFKRIFSTWNFIDTDHLADFHDEESKIYLELSFWLYEMPIFHCIAIHEIYHKYYFNENNLVMFDEEKDLSFFKENLPNTIKEETGLLIESFSENFIMSLYQEILADLHTYMFAKENYVYTLFINGFLSEFNHSFLKVPNSNKNPSYEEKCCFQRMNNISIYNFDFKKKQILYFVRLFFLLKYIKKYDYEVYKHEIIQFIEEVLLTVFPVDYNNTYENFDNFLKDFIAHKTYKKNKYIIHILVEIYYRFFIFKGALYVVNKRKEKIKRAKYCDKYTNRFTKFLDEIKKLEINNINKSKFIQINHLVQENFRKDNIEDLGIRLEEENIRERVYFLTNIKVSRYSNKDAFLVFKDFVEKEKIKYFLKKVRYSITKSISFVKEDKKFIEKVKEFIEKDKEFPITDNSFYYSFGPFDFVKLTKKTDNFIEDLETFIGEKNTFFIDNHSLFYVKTYNKNNNIEDGFLNLLLSIDVNNAFSNKENEKNVIREIDKIFEDELLKKYKSKFFFSMGNENLVLLIYNIHELDLEKIITKFHTINNISHISSTILLNKNFFSKKEKYTPLKDLIILVKLKPSNLTNKYNQLFQIIKKHNELLYSGEENIRLFKKLGVYDAKIIISKICPKFLEELIKDIEHLSIDIQIEKEIKVTK